MRTRLRTEGLVQGYGRRDVIRGVDLDLGSGIHGLLGPNGAGKTTLLTTLATVAPPRAGRLTVMGRPVTSGARAREARAHIGFLPQGFAFSPRFTVREFVEYVAWTKVMPRRSVDAAVDDALHRTDLRAQRDTRLGALSGGMLQRAGIAQALVNDPAVLVLDEPTAGLDPEQRFAFRTLLTTLTDKTVVLSTHLVEDVAATCDRVLVLDDGRITFDGSVADLAMVGGAGTGSTGQQSSALEQGYLRTIATASGTAS